MKARDVLYAFCPMHSCIWIFHQFFFLSTFFPWFSGSHPVDSCLKLQSQLILEADVRSEICMIPLMQVVRSTVEVNRWNSLHSAV